uniref:Uncharacterized protein n=1 Tax=Chromera velia CCMP2878 TaxID=1169474 RepID=A0A0G4HWR0_9ALVE|eukprot:Cvel_9113.t1-p1 / transcript=Cvel_9113.t1 / gene=Cvel_9113 / organism=Chromera_velia_CCMP2878 / gene_product=hypothetical protein / transcript_product=hypothetical protein / location=Cvel_scaffold517:64918-65265(+) / protein_length=116 / sequence_SO=supercontig / SO=protein_coding / is_pseudo=false
MGLFTASNVLFFFQVYQIRLGSDTEWSKAMMTTMGTSLLQCIQAFWGGRICLHAFTYRDMKGTVMYECYNRGRDAYCITVIVTMYFFLSFLIVVYTTWGIFFPPIRRNINQMKHVK